MLLQGACMCVLIAWAVKHIILFHHKRFLEVILKNLYSFKIYVGKMLEKWSISIRPKALSPSLFLRG